MTHSTCTHEATPKARATCRATRAEVTRVSALPYAWNIEILLADSRGTWREARFLRADDEAYSRVMRRTGQYHVVTRSGDVFTVMPDQIRYLAQ